MWNTVEHVTFYTMKLYWTAAQYLDHNFMEEYLIGLINEHMDPNLEEVMTLYNFKDLDYIHF